MAGYGRISIKLDRISDKQINFINILTTDLMISLKGRNQLIDEIIGREIGNIGELTKEEAHKIIEEMKRIKGQMR